MQMLPLSAATPPPRRYPPGPAGPGSVFSRVLSTCLNSVRCDPHLAVPSILSGDDDGGGQAQGHMTTTTVRPTNHFAGSTVATNPCG